MSSTPGSSIVAPKDHIRSSLYFSIFGPIVAFAILVGLFYAQIRNLLDLASITQQHQENSYLGSTILRSLIDMETGVRGFYMSGDRTFLQPYEEGKVRFTQMFPELKERVKDDTLQSKRVLALSNLRDQWVAYEKGTLDQFRSLPHSELIARELYGKQLMDNIRGVAANFIQIESTAVNARRIQITENAERAIVWGGILGLGIGILLALTIRYRTHRIVSTYETNSALMQQAQRELHETNENLEGIVQARTKSLQITNQELEAFSYSVSHDLRAPLRGIDGFSQALSEDYARLLDERGKKYIRYIREGVQRMGHLIDDMLNLARLNRVEVRFDLIDLVEIAEDVMETFRRNEKTAAWTFRVTGTADPHAWCDRGLMTAALENLFGNAIKYSAGRDNTQIEFGRFADGPGRTTFVVRDNGIGFDMQYSEKLFKAFQRLHSAGEYKGSGIGLATVKRIISRHGGEIWADSAEGHGANFYFTLASSRPM